MPQGAEFKQTLCVHIDGFSLHGEEPCAADDRQALEGLCRFITRPVLAQTKSAPTDRRERLAVPS